MGAASVVDKDAQYILNQCTRYLARDNSDPRHNFGQYSDEDRRAAICEAWRFPVVDSFFDPADSVNSYQDNDVTFVYDGRADHPTNVAVVGTFGTLYAPTPLQPVLFAGESIGFFSVSLRVPKSQVHSYKFLVDGKSMLDPVNPQQVVQDNGQKWSQFFTDACQVPLFLNRRERDLLGRLVAHLLPFRLKENSQFIRLVYDSLDRAVRHQEYPLAYRLDEEVGVVNYIDKVLTRAEQHNADDYRTCLRIIDGLLRARLGGLDPLVLAPDVFADLYAEMETDQVDGWDTRRYASPRFFLLLLRRHAMTGAFVHPRSGGNSGAAGWMYLEDRYRDAQGGTLFDWRRAIEAPLGHSTDYRG
jgi:hypothetical protein